MRVLAHLGLLLLAATYLAPLGLMVAGSLQPDEARVLSHPWGVPSLHNYADVLERVDFPRFLLSSVIVSAGVVGLGLVVNSMAGYALACLRWRGREAARWFVLALLVLPFEAVAVPLFYLVSIAGLRDTFLVQIAPFVAQPLAIYLFYSFFATFPRELQEAAWLDGADSLRVFWLVVAPSSLPTFGSVAILTFLSSWGAYLWPLLVTSSEAVRPLPLAIATFHSQPPIHWGDIFAFGVLLVIPVTIVFCALQPWFVKGVVRGGLKG